MRLPAIARWQHPCSGLVLPWPRHAAGSTKAAWPGTRWHLGVSHRTTAIRDFRPGLHPRPARLGRRGDRPDRCAGRARPADARLRGRASNRCRHGRCDGRVLDVLRPVLPDHRRVPEPQCWRWCGPSRAERADWGDRTDGTARWKARQAGRSPSAIRRLSPCGARQPVRRPCQGLRRHGVRRAKPPTRLALGRAARLDRTPPRH